MQNDHSDKTTLMEQENTIGQHDQPKKIYREKAIYAATYLGGPLVAGYLISSNFKVFHEPGKATRTWIYAVIATVIVFGGAFLIPHMDKIPRPLIPLIYTGITYYLVKNFQGATIRSHIESGGSTYTWWRTLLISIIGLIITIIPVFLIFSSIHAITPAAHDYRDVKTYGTIKNEIYFNAKEISGDELDQIAAGLTKTGFFGNDQKRAVYVKETGNRYILSIVIGPILNQDKLLAVFTKFRNQMQAFLPGHPVAVNLVEEKTGHVVKHFE